MKLEGYILIIVLCPSVKNKENRVNICRNPIYLLYGFSTSGRLSYIFVISKIVQNSNIKCCTSMLVEPGWERRLLANVSLKCWRINFRVYINKYVYTYLYEFTDNGVFYLTSFIYKNLGQIGNSCLSIEKRIKFKKWARVIEDYLYKFHIYMWRFEVIIWIMLKE